MKSGPCPLNSGRKEMGMSENGHDEKKSGVEPLPAAGEGEKRRRGPTEVELRKARNAAKLRENLLKRKAQVWARRQGEAENGIGLPASRAPEGDEG